MDPQRTAPASCRFCDIVAHPDAADVVCDTTYGLVFLDRRPLFPGHCLVIPKAHRTTLMDLPEEEVEPLFALARRTSRALMRALACQGVFVGVNNGVSQSVPHLHVHVVPRSKGDGLKGFFWPRHPYPNDAARARVRELIAQAM